MSKHEVEVRILPSNTAGFWCVRVELKGGSLLTFESHVANDVAAHLLGARESGRYRVTVERVQPRVPRVRWARKLSPRGLLCTRCGWFCGPDRVLCSTCGAEFDSRILTPEEAFRPEVLEGTE